MVLVIGSTACDHVGNPLVAGGLTGIWDCVSTRRGVGLLAWDGKAATVTFPNTSASLFLSGETGAASWATFDGKYFADGLIQVTRTGGESVDTGAVPIPLGGAWTLRQREGECQVAMTRDQFTSNCNTAIFRVPRKMSARRTRPAASVFGDLGGVWVFETNGAPRCQAEIVDATIKVDCGGKPAIDISVDGDVVSGTALGVEFTGRRR